MEHAELIARLGLQQLNGGTTTANKKANKLDNLKTLVHTYKKKLNVKNSSLSASKWFQQGLVPSQAPGSTKGLVIRDEPAFETLNRAGRSILYKKQKFTWEEAKLFIEGDLLLSRQGLIHLCGVEDFDLRSSALVLLDDLLLNEEIDHPSREVFRQVFAGINHHILCKELCLDLHALRPRTRLTAFRLADAIPASADVLMRNNKQALNLYFDYARANEPEQFATDGGNGDGEGLEPAERPHDGLPTTWNELGIWNAEEEEEDIFPLDPDSQLAEDNHQEGERQFSPYVLDPLGFHVTGRVARDKTPEQTMQALYPQAKRDELVRGLANLHKDLQVKRLQERKLVHDRLNDFIKIRFALEGLARSLADGIATAKSAQHSLSLSKEVVDVHFRPLLEREQRKSRAKDALDLVRSPASRFLFTAATLLDELTVTRDFVRGLEVIEKIQVEENVLGFASLPFVFKQAKESNQQSMQKFVLVLQEEILSNAKALDKQTLTTFVRVKQRFVSIGDRQVVLDLHELKAKQVRQVLGELHASSRRMDLSSRATKVVSELMSHFEKDFPHQPHSIPPNLLVRYEAAIVALERYSAYALEVMDKVTEVELDYVQWTSRLAKDNNVAALDPSAVVDFGRDLLHQVLIESAPPLVPLDCHILLSLARDLEVLWKPSQVLFPQANNSSGTPSTPNGSMSSASLLQSGRIAGGKFIFWRQANVLAAVMRLNEIESGMEQFAKTTTAEVISLALDELLAQMEGVQRSIGLMRLDMLLPVDVYGDNHDVFLAPLLEFCWQQISFVLDQVVRPLLESTKQFRVELVRTLNVQERFTKSVRVLGTIMGKCAELSRLSRKGFLILTRDCQLLTSKRIKTLDYHCAIDELQTQFERLEPALATQYLKACVTTCADRIPDALESDAGEDGGVSDVWMMLLHDLSEFVNECESFIGTRYAKKLQSGLAMFLVTQIVELVQKKQVAKLGSARCKQVELDLVFFGQVLELKDEAFLSTIKSLNDKSRWKAQDRREAVDRECAKHSWLVASFLWQ
ncbi:hypothetical protein BASA81_001525 [Batrachochytrium salamandrivorans]|nr:hypothetical protein BASA81_001525 [Batrachochytrium salamandrivorans]